MPLEDEFSYNSIVMIDQVIDIIFSNPTLLTATCIFAFLAGAVLVYQMMPDERASAAKKMLGVVDESYRENKILLLKILHPILVIIGANFHEVKSDFIADYKRKRKKRILAAGLNREITPEEFIAFKIVMLFLFPLLAHYLATVLEYQVSVLTYHLCAIFGFFAPEVWLMELFKKRRRAIFRSLPYTLDLLTLSVEAGLDFIAAIQRLVSTSKSNPLIDELKILLNEISVGASRADALRNLAERVQMEEINSFTTLLIQADQLGASIGKVLRAQSDSMRTVRFQRAEIAGARASQLVLFPMIFCIFPAIFIIILGPLIVKFLSSGLTGLF